jgi:hypothetical protein
LNPQPPEPQSGALTKLSYIHRMGTGRWFQESLEPQAHKIKSLSRGDVFDIEQLAALDAGLEELDMVGALSLGFVHQLVGPLN